MTRALDSVAVCRAKRSTLALLAVLTVSLFAATAAHATSRLALGKFGGPAGTTGGVFKTARGVAVNLTGAGGVPAGSVYVVNASNSRIQQFSTPASGGDATFVRTFGKEVDQTTGGDICTAASGDTCKAGTSSAAAGALAVGGAYGIAVDQTTGAVYVSDKTNRRVDVFAATGAFEGAIGWNVNSTTPEEALQFCTTATGCKAGVAGSAPGQLSNPNVGGLAVDPRNGDLYVSDLGNLRLAEYSIATNGSDEVTGASFIRAIGWDTIPGGAEGTGTLNATTTVSAVATTKKAFRVGQTVTALGLPGAIPAGTTITAVGTNTLTLSQAATTSATGVTLEVAEGSGNVPGNEKQLVTVPSTVTSGTFQPKFEAPKPQTVTNPQTTAAIPYNATVTQVQAALEALTNIGPNLTVGLASGGNAGGGTQPGGPWAVEFNGTRFSDTNVAQMTVATNPTNGTVTVETIAEGTALESCTTTSGCQAGTSGVGLGQFLTNDPGPIAVDSSGDIYAVNVQQTGNCSATESCRVFKFNPDGSFKEVFGPVGGECQLTYTSGAAQSEEAFAIAVDPVLADDDNRVYVAKKISAGEYRVYELNEGGTSCAPSPGASSAALTAGTTTGGVLNYGLALGSDNRLYANSATTNAGEVVVLGEAPPPIVHFGEVTGIGPEGAKVAGTVTPPEEEGGNRFETTWHFEYSTDQAHWTKVPVPDQSAGSVPDVPVPVEVTLSGLTPRTTYFVRLCATTGPTVCDPAPPAEFTTEGAVPAILEQYASSVAQGSALIDASVNPKNSQTSYFFEWASQSEWEGCACYGHRIPSFARVLGAGNEALVAQEELTGLTPGSVYHFRVVTTNGTGTIPGPDQEFITLDTSGLPDNRVPELVSPADLGPLATAGEVVNFTRPQMPFQVSSEGNGVAYDITPGVGNPTAGGEVIYGARRSPSGWLSEQLSPPALDPANRAAFNASSYLLYASSDLGCEVFASPNRLTADAPLRTYEEGAVNLYRRTADGLWTLLTGLVPTNPNAKLASLGFSVVGASPDCGRIYFESSYQYESVGQGGRDGGELYEWDEAVSPHLRHVGFVPGPSGEVPVPANGGVARDYSDAVSADGERVVFTATRQREGAVAAAENDKQAVFVRLDGTETVDVSESQTKTPDLAATYQGASTVSEDAKVFFLANYGLTDDSSSGPATCTPFTPPGILGSGIGQGCDLYEYDLSKPVGERLTDISADENAADTAGASVVGLLGSSADGSDVYFASPAQLVKGQGENYAANVSNTTYNIYLSHEGEAGDRSLSYVGSLGRGEAERQLTNYFGSATGLQESEKGSPYSRVTPDGDHLLFESSLPFNGYQSGGVSEAYIYSLESGRSTCVSCRRDGQAPLGGSGATPLYTGLPRLDQLHPPMTLSADGSTAFFESPDPLAPGAVPGNRNIFEWRRGTVYLLASGQTKGAGDFINELLYIGASEDASNVFIITPERLASQDTDGRKDVYDLRVGGSFPPAEPEPPALCDPLAEGACVAPPSPAPSPSPAATPAFHGPGNPPAPSPKANKKPHRKKHSKHHHRKNGHNKKKAHKRIGKRHRSSTRRAARHRANGGAK